MADNTLHFFFVHYVAGPLHKNQSKNVIWNNFVSSLRPEKNYGVHGPTSPKINPTYLEKQCEFAREIILLENFFVGHVEDELELHHQCINKLCSGSVHINISFEQRRG